MNAPTRRPRRPRWRCGDPDCPAHRWQPVTDLGEFDPVDAATGALEAHWATAHDGEVCKTGTVDRGRWKIAGTPAADPYPCMCLGERPCGRRCPCRGRSDADNMPAVCCARRASETAKRAGESA